MRGPEGGILAGHIAKGSTMTNSTPDQEAAPEQAQTPAQAQTPDQAESPEDADPQEVPSTEELEEPSTEKAPGEEPRAPKRAEPEPDHEAVGIGVIGQPQIDEDAASES